MKHYQSKRIVKNDKIIAYSTVSAHCFNTSSQIHSQINALTLQCVVGM